MHQYPAGDPEASSEAGRGCFHVVAPAVGPWQQRLNELGGVKLLVFGQYGEIRPGLEELLVTIAEAGAGEAAERYLINHHLAAKSIQLRLVWQWVVMAVQKAQAGVLINRLRYALPGWDGAEGRRDAQEDFYESAQAREFADRVEFTHPDFDYQSSISREARFDHLNRGELSRGTGSRRR
jgi:hypothetical protein